MATEPSFCNFCVDLIRRLSSKKNRVLPDCPPYIRNGEYYDPIRHHADPSKPAVSTRRCTLCFYMVRAMVVHKAPELTTYVGSKDETIIVRFLGKTMPSHGTFGIQFHLNDVESTFHSHRRRMHRERHATGDTIGLRFGINVPQYQITISRGQLMLYAPPNSPAAINGDIWMELPKTFRDAINVTKSIGVDYIRIDSLCIIHDDEHDWISEAERIGDIYENAHVTLMATDSWDGRGGLFP
ncbi:hypothetical protein B0T24DRAFT_718011 [Lasiosphaeria ovina]|uniref:Heterokaryon incompatibility domain-containing protein n=1 Tax=Lasiosphaeria ovina TaxID=92902 RepID=A0AAE0NFQ6_9PEZI|nr:hypothetical protein B0T24DRAFT_718011 [Lasiosphaeria ovina]